MRKERERNVRHSRTHLNRPSQLRSVLGIGELRHVEGHKSSLQKKKKVKSRAQERSKAGIFTRNHTAGTRNKGGGDYTYTQTAWSKIDIERRIATGKEKERLI